MVAMIERADRQRAMPMRRKAMCCSHVPSDPDYGALSRRDREAMIAGARVEVAPYKRDPADFVLWKPSDEGVVGWDSPWGRGRPGWHIECSAMIRAHLGETIDIHGGGLDLIFPHHENEIAQSRCAHGGKPLARYWVHNGFVDMGAEKMSKSLGNIVTPAELLAAGHQRRNAAAGAAVGALPPAAAVDRRPDRAEQGDARPAVPRVAATPSRAKSMTARHRRGAARRPQHAAGASVLDEFIGARRSVRRSTQGRSRDMLLARALLLGVST